VLESADLIRPTIIRGSAWSICMSQISSPNTRDQMAHDLFNLKSLCWEWKCAFLYTNARVRAHTLADPHANVQLPISYAQSSERQRVDWCHACFSCKLHAALHACWTARFKINPVISRPVIAN
jgi:hypothetical protein